MDTGQSARTRRRLFLLLKLTVSAACIFYISTKIDFSAAAKALITANPFWLLAALAGYILSKLVSAWRLNIYFRDAGLALASTQNIRLYWLGMFYNLFLPGAVSGDAYKVMLLNKRYKTGVKLLSAAVIIDRFSGLLGLGLLLASLSFFVPGPGNWQWLLTIMSILSVTAVWLLIRRYLPAFIKSFQPTLLAGIAVQLLQLCTILMIWKAVDAPAPVTLYLFLFLVSSAVAVLPLTIGGLGIRELVFLKGTMLLGGNMENAVLISFIFYLLSLISSVPGLYFIFRDPLNE